jgi:hypothetical protein
VENQTTPTYPILCNWSELLYASEALKVRADKIRAHDEHMAKVRKGIKELAEETERRIPCRCGVDVRQCRKGCTLFACCGGYTNEGHMSDCPGARPETVGGR